MSIAVTNSITGQEWSITTRLPPAAELWALSGPPGPALDFVGLLLVQAGATVTAAGPSRYHARGAWEVLAGIAEAVAAYLPDLALGPDAPSSPTVAVTSAYSTPRGSERVSTFSSANSDELPRWVMRAVDRGLAVRIVGVSRFEVRGSTRAQIDWFAAMHDLTPEQAAAAFGLTPEQAAAEDAGTTAVRVVGFTTPLEVNVASTPPRSSRTTIERDAMGDVKASYTVEVDGTTAPPTTTTTKG